MKAAIDTNVLVYATGLNDSVKRDRALLVLDGLASREAILPAQVLAELLHVLVRKGPSREQAIRDVDRWREMFEVAPTDRAAIAAAIGLVSRHGIQVFDAVVLATARQAGCDFLISEDLTHDRDYDGITVLNPFADPPHPVLGELIDTDSAPSPEQTP